MLNSKEQSVIVFFSCDGVNGHLWVNGLMVYGHPFFLPLLTVRFDVFQILEDSKKRRETASKNLRKALEEGIAKYERRIYIELPLISAHQHHFIGEVTSCTTHHELMQQSMKRR